MLRWLSDLVHGRRKNPDPLYESERQSEHIVPVSCPICAGRITMNAESGQWKCVGLKNRDEVLRYLAPEFPKGKTPMINSKPPCGWTGKDEDFGKTWV